MTLKKCSDPVSAAFLRKEDAADDIFCKKRKKGIDKTVGICYNDWAEKNGDCTSKKNQKNLKKV